MDYCCTNQKYIHILINSYSTYIDIKTNKVLCIYCDREVRHENDNVRSSQ